MHACGVCALERSSLTLDNLQKKQEPHWSLIYAIDSNHSYKGGGVVTMDLTDMLNFYLLKDVHTLNVHRTAYKH